MNIRANELAHVGRSVPGVVHGASGTGQTMFVEPLEAIDLNNRLVQLAEDETAEIARILEELTQRVRVDRGPLEAAAQTIAHLDAIFARARFARDFDCVLPQLDMQAARDTSATALQPFLRLCLSASTDPSSASLERLRRA